MSQFKGEYKDRHSGTIMKTNKFLHRGYHVSAKYELFHMEWGAVYVSKTGSFNFDVGVRRMLYGINRQERRVARNVMYINMDGIGDEYG